ncbi:two-component system response regulator [uncultured Desulfobacter sp.]|uniref:two-component system response regulator n=1 Tax=uncultured Desulfobacter sp. TaxID=240139 RepID=UPI002AAAC469|nr:two-component system response regulator [uncultured Desulfobacter sp.]
MAKWKPEVLVVDDEPGNLELLRQILQDKYEMSFATDGQKALTVAQKAKPDIVLLDVMMPEMDGLEVCRRLKNNPVTAKIPVIFVTAMGDVDNEEKGFEAGGVDYITKPVSAPIVHARIRLHLELYNQNRVLEERVEQRTRQLRHAYETIKNLSLDTIYRLARAAEFKDEDTGAHILRMSNYSAAVARKMGFEEKTVESILYAAPLHDIGKIGTPDRILLKPGKLDAAEWEIMKQHTINGGIILEGSEKGFIKLGEIIALTHHERWDGTGYPKGLKGNAIPKIARIIAIADVFDALTTKRPYKEAFPIEKSFAIIKEGRGSQFDPAVVDAFFAVKNDVLAIKEKYKDENQSLLYKITSTSA